MEEEKEEGRVLEERKERAKWWRRENLRVEKKREGESVTSQNIP